MPDIAYIDNEPDAFFKLASEEQQARIRTIEFLNKDMSADFEKSIDAVVWVFDFFLFDSLTPGSESENGLSLYQKWRAASPASSQPTVLVSNHLEKALGESPGPLLRHHIHAQRLGVEWIGNKDKATIDRIVSIADATTFISGELSPKDPNTPVDSLDTQKLSFDVLRVPKNAAWATNAQRRVDRARPPRMTGSLTPMGAARLLIAWLLHNVLPYPSFLVTDAQAALRLGVTASTLEGLMVDDIGGPGLADLVYSGPLSTFHDRRWWRAGVDNLAYELSSTGGDFRQALASRFSKTKVEWLEYEQPVVVSNSDLIETDKVADASSCVRVLDEDFPADVDAAWVLLSDALENRDLAAKVIFEDRPRLEKSA